MRLTQYTDFSLRVLIYLGLRPGERFTIRALADAYGISRNHVVKVVHRLAARGYIDAARGAGGGIMLKGRPDSIRLGRVVRDMEPDFGLVECYRPGNTCLITPACRLPPILEEALEAFLAVLDRYTLADLLPPKARSELAVLLRLPDS